MSLLIYTDSNGREATVLAERIVRIRKDPYGRTIIEIQTGTGLLETEPQESYGEMVKRWEAALSH